MVGIAGIAALLIGHSLVLWYGTRTDYFDRSGKAIKCYVLTRDGKVTYGERAGIDPTTGRLCRLLTAEMLERLKQYEMGKRPQQITDTNPTFFDPRTGEPIVWYYRSKTDIEIFDLNADPPNTVSPSMLASTPAQNLNPICSRRGIPRFNLFGKCSRIDDRGRRSGIQCDPQ
jgi:hypothetical protein